MKLYSTITTVLMVLAKETNAVTSPVTEMALREFQYQSARAKIGRPGYHRRNTGRHIAPGSAITFADLFKHLEMARKVADNKRKMEKMFQKMIKITNGYKN